MTIQAIQEKIDYTSSWIHKDFGWFFIKINFLFLAFEYQFSLFHNKVSDKNSYIFTFDKFF